MKPKKYIAFSFPARLILSFGIAFAGLTATSFAQSTWAGNTDANLATAANWDVLPTSGVSWTFGAAGTAGVTLANNLTASTAFDVAGITFTSASSAYVIDSTHTGTFSLTGNIASSAASSAVTIGSNIAVSGTPQVNLWGGATTANVTLSGNLTGNGSLTQTAGGSGAKSLSLNGDNSGFTGTFTQNNDGNNRTAFNAATAGSAAASWSLNRNVNGGVAFNGIAGSTIHFGSLTGGAFMRSNTGGTTTISVGALNTSTSWSGQINDNGGSNIALTKVGSGTLTLTAANSYDGATTVNAGTLDVTTGTITNSAVTVNNNAIFQISGSGKTLGGLSVTANGTAKIGAVSTLTNGMSATGASGIVDLVNGSVGTIAVNGAAGLTLGGTTGADKPTLKLEAGGTADKLQVANNLVVDAGGASITVTNLGLAAGQTIPLITYVSGSGAGFVEGTGTTVGALTLTNPNLSFGVTGQLEVTATAVNLVTAGATAPDEAYWSGANGSLWNSTSGSNANFTTTAVGGTYLNVLPASNTMVFFSNNSATNLTNTLGAAFDVAGITYRGGSAAVTTTSTEPLTIEGGGITVESGNGGATLGVAILNLAQNQTWQNDSANPLTVSATTISGPSASLTLAGTGSINLGGTSLSVGNLEVAGSLDLKGTAVTANFTDSSGNITNTGAANATLTAANGFDANLSGVISDNGDGSLVQVVKSGVGILTLSGDNAYAGGTTISGGTLKAGHNNAFGSGTVTTNNFAAVLDLNGFTIANPLANSATGATITNSSATESTVSSGFNNAGAALFTISDFTINGTGDIRWDGAINRTNNVGTMTKNGTNTLILNETNGNAPIGNMNLRIENGTVFLGQTTTTFPNVTINGGTLKMDPTYEVSTANTWAGAIGNEAFINGGTWDLNGTGTNGVNNRVKRVSGTGGLITNSNASEALLVLAARDNISPSWAGSIQDGVGPVALTINNSGSGGFGTTMTFSGNNTYSGATSIFDNTMKAGSVTGLSPNSDYTLSNSAGSKLDLGDFNNTIGSLTGGVDSQVLLGSATLTTGAKNDATTTFDGVISGTGGLVKVGAGTFTLTGTNLYTGDTTVSAGILAVDGDAIADTNKLVISGGKVEPTGTEIVNSLYFGAVQKASGTWGATGSGAAHIDDTHFSGSGMVSVATGPAGYAGWASLKGLTAGVNDGANQDPDGDGISNLLEYVLGGEPIGAGASNTSILPTQTLDATNLTLAFKRSDLSELDTTQTVQISTGLGTWTDFATVGATSAGAVTVAEGTDPAPDTVSVAIPRSNALNGKLFARLNVLKN
jgi:fibronectin-binding autotransporter adhesin